MSNQTPSRSPVNIAIVKIDEPSSKRLGRIETGQIFNNMNLFHPEGLFSSEIFGNIGSEARSRTFGLIDLNLQILHPLIYKTVISLKSFYKQIAEGKVTAIFNKKTGEFEKNNTDEASTGYSFFLSHITQLNFEKNESDTRSFQVDLFNKSLKEENYFIDKLIVMPAGLRDYTVDANGKPQEDEVNSFYRKVIAQANIVDPIAAKKNPELYDSVAMGLQKIVLELYEYIESLLDGKNKLILGKWVSRKIFNSTRNVISSYVEVAKNVNDKRRLGYNEVLIGLHQFARASAPKSLYEIKNNYIRDIFIENTTSAYLVNVNTLHREEVLNSHIQKEYDLWTSSDGLEKVIASLGNVDIRNLPVVLNKGKHYLALIYRDDKYFKIVQDIDDIPEGWDKSKVRPITLTEFIYVSLYRMDGKFPGLATRYPITGFGSIYPAMVRLTTTTDTDVLEELDSQWNPTGSIACNFPINDSEHFSTMIVHHSHLASLGGDYDGDMLSLTMGLTDESVEEIKNYLRRKDYYVSDSGQFVFSNSTDTLDAVLTYMT